MTGPQSGRDAPVLPNFLVIGAGKAGTTALYQWLSAHPEVFVTRVKETNYFAHEASELSTARGSGRPEGRKRFPFRSWEAYTELYAGAGAFRARGEASPAYLGWPSVPETIAARLPDVRLLAVLRQPVERAYSSYLMHTRNGGERRAFAEAVREELDGSANPRLPYGQLHYVRLGFYHQLLSPYWERFPRPRLHVELYDDLRDDPQAFLRRVYSFLDVDENFRPDTSVRVNASGIPRRRIFAPLLRKNRVNLLVRALLPRALEVRAGKAYERWRASQLVQPPLDPALRADLIALYRDDIVALGRAIDRDLKRWLE